MLSSRLGMLARMFLFTSINQHTSSAFRQFPICVHSRPTLTLPLRSLASDADTSSDEVRYTPPWNRPQTDHNCKRNNKTRFRQHVNPLASQYQLPTILSENWPKDVYKDLSKPLHLDIGCGKGGFLLEVAKERPAKNYLGLEIRPSVAHFAKERIAKRGLTGWLDFVGCNANVDLDRLLTLHKEQGGGPIDFVSIQFPDPHFKGKHAKRRVVTDDLVRTLAKFVAQDGTVFLQSDVQTVLDDMRDRFRNFDKHFEDQVADVEDYMPHNIIGIATEREISVIERELPVYRTVFKRTSSPFVSP